MARGGGRQPSKVGVQTYFFTENCMTMKEFGLPGGHHGHGVPGSHCDSFYGKLHENCAVRVTRITCALWNYSNYQIRH